MQLIANKKIVLFSLVVLIILFILAAFLPVLLNIQNSLQTKKNIGQLETIRLIIPNGTVEVDAKIDTGADLSSIDKNFAMSLGIDVASLREITIISARGREKRDVTQITFALAGKTITTIATVADRSQLSTKMLIGKDDLSGFVIDPMAEFLTNPGETKRPSFLSLAVNRLLRGSSTAEKELLAIPILGALVVIFYMFFGLKTYGIFGPVVIAITLLHLGITIGLSLYVLMVATGMLAKRYLLSGLKLPHIAELSLVIFILVFLLVGTAILTDNRWFNLADIFFPLIITAHLIDRATKTVEEHRLAEALPTLAATLGLAVILTLAGNFLIQQSLGVLWLIFLSSLPLVIISGNYLGLRLSEVFRFKFLRKVQ